jgi:hypothetical protein
MQTIIIFNNYKKFEKVKSVFFAFITPAKYRFCTTNYLDIKII